MASAAALLGQWQSAALHLPRPANPRGRRRQAAPAGLSNQRQVCCHVNLGLGTAAAAAQTIAAPATRHAAQSALLSVSFSRPCPPRAAPLSQRSSRQTLLTTVQRSRRGPTRLRGTGDHRRSEVSSAVGGGGRCGQRLRPSGPGLAGALRSAPCGEPGWGPGSGRGSKSGIGVRVWNPSSDRRSTSGIRLVLQSRGSESVSGSVWGLGFLVLGPVSCLESASGLSRGSDGPRPRAVGVGVPPPPPRTRAAGVESGVGLGSGVRLVLPSRGSEAGIGVWVAVRLVVLSLGGNPESEPVSGIQAGSNSALGVCLVLLIRGSESGI